MTPLDPVLETALSDLRRRAAWTRTGRVYLELHKLAGEVIEHRVTEERMTEREVEMVMREMPRGWRR